MRRLSNLAPVLLAAVFVAQVVWSARVLDATYDEQVYFGLGRKILTTYEWPSEEFIRHPPLTYYVDSLPLFLRSSEGPDGTSLLLCRLASLFVFGVPLLIAIHKWAKELYGPAAGLLALFLACFSPNLLAHAGLITPDLPLTATGFIATYLHWRTRREGGARLMCAWSLALGLTLLTKGSGILFLVIAAIQEVLVMIRIRSPRRLAGLVVASAGAILVLGAGYGFKGLFDYPDKISAISVVPGRLSRFAALLSMPFLPLPYVESLSMQWTLGKVGWPSFLMGEYSTTGWWHYFLVAFALKETISMMILLVAAGACAVGAARKGGGWLDDVWLLTPPVVLFAYFSFFGRVDIGVRYVLPAFPFLIVFASRSVRLLERAGAPARVALAGLLLWQAVSVTLVAPDYLAYFNELIGGPRNGYRYLVDSNLYWGQNTMAARAYAREHAYVFRPSVLPRSGFVMISANDYQGVLNRPKYRLLREEYEPIKVVLNSWLVFDMKRNRKFREEDLVVVASDATWRASTSTEEGWQSAGRAGGSWSPPVAEDADEPNGFVVAETYPGSTGLLLRCGQEGESCLLRGEFELPRAPARATLHFACKDPYELYVNGDLVGSRRGCLPRTDEQAAFRMLHPEKYRGEEFAAAEHLRPGRNAVAIRLSRCPGEPLGGAFVEMRIARAAAAAPQPAR